MNFGNKKQCDLLHTISLFHYLLKLYTNNSIGSDFSFFLLIHEAKSTKTKMKIITYEV